MADKVSRKSEIEDVPVDQETHDVASLKVETPEFDPVAVKKLLRKVDLHLIPILFLLFLCAFIDRYGLPSPVSTQLIPG